MSYTEVTFTQNDLTIFVHFASIDDYTKDGGPGEIWILRSFHSEPLYT